MTELFSLHVFRYADSLVGGRKDNSAADDASRLLLDIERLCIATDRASGLVEVLVISPFAHNLLATHCGKVSAAINALSVGDWQLEVLVSKWCPSGTFYVGDKNLLGMIRSE